MALYNYGPTGNEKAGLSGQEMSITPVMPLSNVRKFKREQFANSEMYIDIDNGEFEVVRIDHALWTSGPINKVDITIKLKLRTVLDKVHAEGSILEALVLRPVLLQKQPKTDLTGATTQIIVSRQTDIALNSGKKPYTPGER